MSDPAPAAYAGPQRVLSGVQSSGALHLGNYLGALVKFARLQHQAPTFIFIADLHAVTVWQDPARLAAQTREIAAAYIAAGLDPDKAVIFARFATELKPGEWHKVRMEMVGDTMLGKVDDLTAWGSSDLFKQARMVPGFTVGGQSVDFRNLSIHEATLNPEWEAVKATLPKPGEKMAPVTPPAGKGKGKKKAA